MIYEEARSKIKSGDVFAWTHKSWGSWYDFKVQMVRFFTQSEYSHVGIAWVIAGRVFILESVTGGIRIFPLSKEIPFYWIPTDVKWATDVEEFALSHLGEPYSQLQAILAQLGENTDGGADGTWECAEFVKAVLKQAGVVLPNKATPSDVVGDLQALGKPVYLILP